MTVGELKQKLEDVADDAVIMVWNERKPTGVMEADDALPDSDVEYNTSGSKINKKAVRAVLIG